MRASDPDQEGYVKRGSVRVFWERYGAGKPDPSTAMVHPALDAVTVRAGRSTEHRW